MTDQDASPCTLQDVIAYLRDHMQINVNTGRAHCEPDWVDIRVQVWLGDELITEGSDSFTISN